VRGWVNKPPSSGAAGGDLVIQSGDLNAFTEAALLFSSFILSPF